MATDEPTTTPPGATWFIRCAVCGRLWEASEAYQFSTGRHLVCWTRPKTRRALAMPNYGEKQMPAGMKSCEHREAIESWNGTEWVAAPVKHDEAAS